MEAYNALLRPFDFELRVESGWGGGVVGSLRTSGNQIAIQIELVRCLEYGLAGWKRMIPLLYGVV